VSLALKLGLFGLVVLLSGCNKPHTTGSGASIPDISALKPNAKIGTSAVLKLADIDIPVEVAQTEADGKLQIDLKAYGQVFETEKYGIDPNKFSLIDAAGETYSDPLPLLKFPMNVGDIWRWDGTMTAGAEPHKSSAVVTTSAEQLLVPGLGTSDSVLVVVDLSIESGAQTPATRKLRFWFVKDKGLVKRQFGIGSTREPKE
jgi:hypothetical protein